MDVHLLDNISNVTDVEFLWGKIVFYKLADFESAGVDVFVFSCVELSDFFLMAVQMWNNDKPRIKRVVF